MAAALLCPAKLCAADNIVIGRSLPLGGPLERDGQAKRDGGNAYIQKINAAGGVGGRPSSC
jgi:ABC-type branched-subunit amino acid transport system substrate-binding protein